MDIDDDEDDDDLLGESDEVVGEPLIRPDDSLVKYSPIFDSTSIVDDDAALTFIEDDFDDEFDDDFEAEIEGEYELEDDQYGEEFAEVEEAIGMKSPPKRRKRKSAEDAENADTE
ncbi:MAG TPA: hypothetical protein PKD64_02860 [Pirellulaceae bacterium]|nr:hypothetical protein [Pirellulaceae bacterium]HMO91109.1 hypothetical protein [Pirellulaceae bacterium]HMP70544.1 hypothetical protein [Pirellulaceae bacterium]